MNDFDNIYQMHKWGNEVLSGPGSTISSAKNIIPAIIKIIKEKNIKKIVDGSCGDLTWIQKVLEEFPNIQYIGNDISEIIININKSKFKNNKNWKFYKKNAIDEDIEKCDLFIFRHTLMHLANDNIIKILNNISKHCKYVLLTNFPDILINPTDDQRKSIGTSLAFHFEKINLHKYPFNSCMGYLLEEIKESSNNVNDHLNLYKFN